MCTHGAFTISCSCLQLLFSGSESRVNDCVLIHIICSVSDVCRQRAGSCSLRSTNTIPRSAWPIYSCAASRYLWPWRPMPVHCSCTSAWPEHACAEGSAPACSASVHKAVRCPRAGAELSNG